VKKGLLALAVMGGFGFGSEVRASKEGFDHMAAGQPPMGWTCGTTGGGTPRWAIESDDQAPSPPNVLVQRGAATFSWCVVKAAEMSNGKVAVRFKPMNGKEDQAGGVIWRWKDANGYYVARANALENNVGLYYVSKGVRHTIKYQDATVARNVWHRLEVRFHGEHIEVVFDDKPRIEADDRHVTGAGLSGVWTKADSVTAFDDFEADGE
jgi:hypothetical protein